MRESKHRIEGSITVNRPAEEVYSYWRNLENLPRFMEHLESVRETDKKRSHWVVKTPVGTKLEWDAEITEERPNEFIAWRSLPGAEIENEGRVEFKSASGGNATDVKIFMAYVPPGGMVGETAARLSESYTADKLKEEMSRFKQIVESRRAA
jgi:uncharacterized membrane protein